MKNGCDFVLNETQSHFDEIKIICDFCYSKNVPFVISLLVTEKLTLLSGEKVSEVINFILDRHPLSLSFNCISPNVFDSLFKKIKLNFNWGVYLNLGGGSIHSKSIVTGVSAEEYAEMISKYLYKQPSFIGGCCGSNPNHIKKLRQVLDGKFNN